MCVSETDDDNNQHHDDDDDCNEVAPILTIEIRCELE